MHRTPLRNSTDRHDHRLFQANITSQQIFLLWPTIWTHVDVDWRWINPRNKHCAGPIHDCFVIHVASRERVRHDNHEKQPESVSLTQRQLEVLQLLAEGESTTEISKRLAISPRTTENHLSAIFRKLDTPNRTKAVVRAVSMGIVNIE